LRSDLTAKSLLINCYRNPTKIDGLNKILENYGPCKVVYYLEINQEYQIDKVIDSVIISGSEYRITEHSDRVKFKDILDFIKICNLPIFGICFGHQLLCSAFGAKTGKLQEPVINRFENIRVLQTDNLFASIKEGGSITLSEYHNDYVLKEGLDNAGFVLLADSVSCEVEAVEHKSKPFYGVQFHPERINIKGELHLEGHRVIENFYRNIVKR